MEDLPQYLAQILEHLKGKQETTHTNDGYGQATGGFVFAAHSDGLGDYTDPYAALRQSSQQWGTTERQVGGQLSEELGERVCMKPPTIQEERQWEADATEQQPTSQPPAKPTFAESITGKAKDVLNHLKQSTERPQWFPYMFNDCAELVEVGDKMLTDTEIRKLQERKKDDVVRVLAVPPADHEPLLIILAHLPEGRGVTKDDVWRWRVGFRHYREQQLLGHNPEPPRSMTQDARKMHDHFIREARAGLEQSLRGKWQA
jgi:hypothetical protein